MECLLPYQIEIAMGPNPSYISTPFEQVINNLEANFSSPPLSEIEASESLLSQPWTLKPFDVQLQEFNRIVLYTNTCNGYNMSELTRYRHLLNKSTTGILAAHLANCVERHIEVHSSCGAAITATQANFVAVLRPRFTSMTPDQIASFTVAQANAISVLFSGSPKAVLDTAHRLANDTDPSPPAKPSSRHSSPSAATHAGSTPVRQGRTNKSQTKQPSSTTAAKYCSYHNVSSHNSSDCAQILLLSPGLKKSFLSRPKPK
jgi:hypothetical protein